MWERDRACPVLDKGERGIPNLIKWNIVFG
jgi:hypothetical protein